MIPISKYVDMSVKERGGLIRKYKIEVEKLMKDKNPNIKIVNKLKYRIVELVIMNNSDRMKRYDERKKLLVNYWDSFVA